MNISQLLDNALQNDQRSYNQLFDIHWDYVYGFLLKKTRNPIVAEEIAVRSFSNAFDKIHQFDREARFSTWLIAIAQNLWIDSERKNQSQKTRFTETRAEVSEFENFQKNPNKLGYLYLLTPMGFSAKAQLTASFLRRKMLEYETLRTEIDQLRAEVDGWDE